MKLPEYTPPSTPLKQAKPILIVRVLESVSGENGMKVKESIADDLNNEYHVMVLSDKDVKKLTFELVK